MTDHPTPDQTGQEPPDIPGRLPEWAAELDQAEKAYTKAGILYMLAEQEVGQLSDVTGVEWGAATFRLGGYPFRLGGILAYYQPSRPPDSRPVFAPFGPNSAFIEALESGDAVFLGWRTDYVIAVAEWLDRLRAVPEERYDDEYELTPAQVLELLRVRGVSSTPLTLANYADEGLIPAYRDVAMRGAGQGHRRYPKDTAERVETIKKLQRYTSWANARLAELIQDGRQWP